jgi:hypothetical protein
MQGNTHGFHCVAVVLFLFRKIYGEVVETIPLNGGAYNVLLNTSSKKLASVAATWYYPIWRPQSQHLKECITYMVLFLP